MHIYMAPLEGITGFVFRNAYAKYYKGVDKYFTPFITPHTKKNMDAREKRDILPENNEGIPLVPQVLTNQAQDLIAIGKELKEIGYQEMNLNLGCPSGTVAAKKKGSGFLGYPRELEQFFEAYYEQAVMPLSIKTRIGWEDTEEYRELFSIFEKFPFTEVIVHPRIGKEFYNGTPHRDIFSLIGEKTHHSLCYNGDIFTMDDYTMIQNQNPACEKYMLGRGLLWNPRLAEEIALGISDAFDKEQFHAFHDEIVNGYGTYLSGDRNVLFRMKELWGYWMDLFPNEKSTIKQIRKSSSIAEYCMLVDRILAK